ncbi:hypothetical protein A0H81_01540 [Grifola frondosa]|uniref:Uncharacterized protein n=1 Tax=Grifola frondosa TaxID=5627 RepID=A0A1C7MQS3_GRIFR|nr:hypothetical protein A0H81_01540 [Grifola frondosa]
MLFTFTQQPDHYIQPSHAAILSMIYDSTNVRRFHQPRCRGQLGALELRIDRTNDFMNTASNALGACGRF